MALGDCSDKGVATLSLYRVWEPETSGLRFSSGVLAQDPPSAPQLPGGEVERGLWGGEGEAAGRRFSLAMSGFPTLTRCLSSTKSSMPR